jgi:hypothetical protein
VPVHVPIVGVTVIVAVIGDVVDFVAVKDGILPVPEAAKPMEASEFVQLNVAPVGLLVNVVALTVLALHTVVSEGTFTVIAGQLLAVQVAVLAAKHPVPVGVTVMVTLSPAVKPPCVKVVPATVPPL